MHTNSTTSGPLYAAALQPAARPDARLPRAVQSAAAEGLLRDLRRASGIEGGASSKAHSRAYAAAALAAAGRIGVDIEFCAPGRRILEIAQYLSGEPAADAAAGYRLFTFREAYFKAFGKFPEPSLLRRIAAGSDGLCETSDFQILHQAIAPDVVFTLVWTGGGVPRRLR